MNISLKKAMRTAFFGLFIAGAVLVGGSMFGGGPLVPSAHAWFCSGNTSSSPCGTLTTVVNVVNAGGTKTASDFQVTLTDESSGTFYGDTLTFVGSASGTIEHIDPEQYLVSQAPKTNYTVSYSADCSGTIATGDAKTCTITDTYTATGGSCTLSGSLTNSVNNATPNVGDTIVYTLNNGSFSATTPTQITVTDQLGAGLTFVSATSSIGNYSSSTGIWDLGTVSGALSGASLTITATVDASAAGHTITNTPTINYPKTCSCTKSSAISGDATIKVQNASQYADLSVSKTADVTSTSAGSTIHYTIAVKDLGPATSTGVVATDTLPTGLTFVSETSTEGSYASSTGLWTIGTLAASSTATLNITALVNQSAAGTTITNTAIVGGSTSTIDRNPSNNSSTVSIPVSSGGGATPGSIQVCKLIQNASGTFIDGSAFPGSMFSISGIAAVPSSTASPIGTLPTTTFTTPLALNTKVLGASTSTAQCVTYGNLPIGHYYYGQEGIAATTTTWAAPSYDDQDSGVATSVANFYGYSGQLFDSNPSNDGQRNTDADGDIFLTAARPDRQLLVLNTLLGMATTTAPTADISINKTVDNANPSVGDTVNYTLTVAALGPATSTGVVASDTLPSGVTFSSETSTEGSYASSTGLWTIGDMSASSTATLKIAATVNSGTAGTTIYNTGTVSESTSTIDNNPGNNSSTVPITVQGGGGCTSGCGGGSDADIAITKTVDATSTQPGGTVNYTITAIAHGPQPSTDVVATDTLPSGLTFQTSTASVGNYDSLTGAWTIGTMSASSTATLTISATVNATGTAGTTITNQATIGESSTLTDTNTANNTAQATTTVGNGGGSSNQADLAIVKTVDNTNPITGSTVNFTVVVTNNGPASDDDIVAHDQLPVGLATISVTSTPSTTFNMATGVWDIGTLAPNATATLNVSAEVSASAGTVITNTATVTSTLTSIIDPNPANNSSTVTLNVQSSGGGCTSNCGGGGNTPSAEIGIVKTVDNANPASGSTINYTLTVAATGPSASFGVVANDVLPSGLTYDSATSTEGSYASSTGIWTIGTMNNGTTATLKITATVTAANGTTITNTGTVHESPTVVDPLSGNNSSSVTITVGGSGGGGGGGGSVLGASTSTGQVLGASCGLYLTQYIHPIRKDLNDPTEVKKLQTFLNQNLGSNLPVTGYYGNETIAAVNQFQVKYHIEVLAPWVPLGLPTQFTPTSYVYQTTQRWINLIMCPPLNLAVPALKVDNSE